jgi:hypothetical protein
MVTRRSFLSTSAAVSASAAALALAAERDPGDIATAAPPALPAATLYDKNEEAYWAEVRKQFLSRLAKGQSVPFTRKFRGQRAALPRRASPQ